MITKEEEKEYANRILINAFGTESIGLSNKKYKHEYDDNGDPVLTEKDIEALKKNPYTKDEEQLKDSLDIYYRKGKYSKEEIGIDLPDNLIKSAKEHILACQHMARIENIEDIMNIIDDDSKTGLSKYKLIYETKIALKNCFLKELEENKESFKTNNQTLLIMTKFMELIKNISDKNEYLHKEEKIYSIKKNEFEFFGIMTDLTSNIDRRNVLNYIKRFIKNIEDVDEINKTLSKLFTFMHESVYYPLNNNNEIVGLKEKIMNINTKMHNSGNDFISISETNSMLLNECKEKAEKFMNNFINSLFNNKQNNTEILSYYDRKYNAIINRLKALNPLGIGKIELQKNIKRNKKSVVTKYKTYTISKFELDLNHIIIKTQYKLIFSIFRKVLGNIDKSLSGPATMLFYGSGVLSKINFDKIDTFSETKSISEFKEKYLQTLIDYQTEIILRKTYVDIKNKLLNLIFGNLYSYNGFSNEDEYMNCFSSLCSEIYALYNSDLSDKDLFKHFDNIKEELLFYFYDIIGLDKKDELQGIDHFKDIVREIMINGKKSFFNNIQDTMLSYVKKYL